MDVTGTIENISFKDSAPGAPRQWSKVSVQVQGEWYGAFKNGGNSAMLATLAKGSEVTVTYEKDKSGKYNNFTDIKVVSVAAVPLAQAAAGAAAEATTTVAASVNYSQYRMSHAGGRNAAVGIIAAALEHDSQFPFDDKENRIISLPKAQNKRLDALVALVGTIGVKLGEDNWLAEPQVKDDDEGYQE